MLKKSSHAHFSKIVLKNVQIGIFFREFSAKSLMFELKIGKIKLVNFSRARVLNTFGIFPCILDDKHCIEQIE